MFLNGVFRVAKRCLHTRMTRQDYEFFLILDFEATCDKYVQPDKREIIEFPCLKVDSRTFQVVSKFHEFVKPTRHPILSPFCSKLTGIVQETVDESHPFPVVLQMFNDWLRSENLVAAPLDDVTPGGAGMTSPSRWLFITCGEWDLQCMLPDQCALCQLQSPAYAAQWANVKALYAESCGHWPRSLSSMLESLSLQRIGRAHSGLDDCLNIVTILQRVCTGTEFGGGGCVVAPTSALH